MAIERIKPARFKTPEYQTWCAMRARCANPKRKDYSYWGGKGIKVCRRWDNFANFLSDMGKRPDGYSIDRIDHDKDYGPDNCRWADAVTQNNNRTNNNKIFYMGKSLTLSQWARELNIKRSTLAQRFYVYKWPINKILKGNQ